MSQAEAKVHIYGSSVSGSRKIKDGQRHLETILSTHNIPFVFKDLAADDEAKSYMRKNNGGVTALPQIFVNGEFRGVYDDFAEAVEADDLEAWLAIGSKTKAQKEDEEFDSLAKEVDEEELRKLAEES
ncbi:hypothetical protein BJ684DRAFT_20964 [Piptocephalis cylindrospora]|uniref:Uncharacterized protein n=1 Tax=Piptocephalis cylindrospora TaxID=1907219 RepID=A0A4P9Y168_9FUNG|nr:hypothetical protein BJ684DRAFT_20964 [Piptocephalis cylindrospora]|eukprot:RKP12507.1 hypothetical protein BJ684DRAFT_20964 [Piptocephalis cylindrospora]